MSTARLLRSRAVEELAAQGLEEPEPTFGRHIATALQAWELHVDPAISNWTSALDARCVGSDTLWVPLEAAGTQPTIGPNAWSAANVLAPIQAAGQQHLGLRVEAAVTVGSIRPSAEAGVSPLCRTTGTPWADRELRVAAFRSLSQLGWRSLAALPTLVDRLQEQASDLAVMAATKRAVVGIANTIDRNKLMGLNLAEI